MIEVPPRESSWLGRFFAGENALSWREVIDGSGPIDWLALVLPWLRFVQDAPVEKPLVLPVFGKHGPARWYGVADDRRVLAQAADEVRGFVGPSYSDFDGHVVELAESSPVESALRDRFGSLAIRFSPSAGVDPMEIGRGLLTYQGVLARRPRVRDRSQRPFGRVRGDFDRALLAGDAVAGKQFLEEMLASGRISADQRKCLEVRYLAGLGRYQELASNHALIVSVADLPLPTQTLVDIISALHIVFVAPLEGGGDIKVVQQAFRSRIAAPFGSLFRQWHGIRDLRVLRSFLLYESLSETPNRTRAEALIDAYPSEGEGRGFARAIFDSMGFGEIVAAAAPIEEARQAIDDEDYERAAELCFKLIPDSWAFRALLRCAVAVDSADLTARVLAAISEAGSALIDGLTKRDRARLEQLSSPQAVASIRIEGDWIQWVDSVLLDANPAPRLTALEAAYPTWSVADLAADSQKCRVLAIKLGSAQGGAEEIFREAFPRLVEFFVMQPETPARTFAPIYIVLLQMVAWSDSASANEMVLCSSIADSLLSTGPNKQSYEGCVDALSEILKSNDSPSSIDWALNVSDMLAVRPTSRPDLRLQFFTQAVALCQRWNHRLSKAQYTILGLLAKDFECRDLLASFTAFTAGPSEAEESQRQAQFRGLIGIYTLARGAAVRAKEVLRELLPLARIELNEDIVATDRLKDLAKTADIFVFAWKKSTHQAFYCAKEARGAQELAMAAGGGAASLVRVVIESPQLQ